MGNAAKNAPTPNFQFSQGKEENSSDVLESFFLLPLSSPPLQIQPGRIFALAQSRGDKARVAGGGGGGRKKTIVGQDKGIPFAPL